MCVWQILTSELIMFHVMAQMMKECLEIVKSEIISLTNQFLTVSHVQVVIVQILNSPFHKNMSACANCLNDDEI